MRLCYDQEYTYSDMNDLQKLNELVKYMKTIKSNTILSIFGLRRNNDKGTVEVKLNGREINICDAENFCCKLHIVINKILPQRRINLPTYLNVHCHPIWFGSSKHEWGG